MIRINFFDKAFETKLYQPPAVRGGYQKPPTRANPRQKLEEGEQPFDPSKICRSMWVYPQDLERVKREGPNTFKTLPITVDDIPHRVPYAERLRYLSIPHWMVDASKHIGTRKMFLAELSFLTHHMKKHNDYKYCIYFGSAPHMKCGLLNRLFPNIIWILVDANEHFIWHKGNRDYSHYKAVDSGLYVYMRVAAATPKLDDDKSLANNMKYHTDQPKTIRHYKSDAVFDKRGLHHDIEYGPDAVDYILGNTKARVFIFEQYADRKLTRDTLSHLVARSPYEVLIMSDVRLENSSLGVLSDQALYYTWIHDLIDNNTTTVHSCFKMRFPFLDSDPIPDISKYQQVFDDAEALDGHFKTPGEVIPFFDGVVAIQPWAIHNSTEGRLWSNREQLSRLRNWNAIEYEQKYAYYNRFMRHVGMFPNKLADKQLGFDHCGDCALEAHQLCEYCERFPEAKMTPEAIHAAISEIGLKTLRGIKTPAHGRCFPDEPFELTSKSRY